MATRSRIGIQLDDGRIRSTYHHWDGYPKWLGVQLEQLYTNRESINELLDGGDISCVSTLEGWRDREGNKTRFESPKVLYYNDRGERTTATMSVNIYDYLKLTEDCTGEYAYLFVDNRWICYNIDTKEIEPIPEAQTANVSN